MPKLEQFVATKVPEAPKLPLLPRGGLAEGVGEELIRFSDIIERRRAAQDRLNGIKLKIDAENKIADLQNQIEAEPDVSKRYTLRDNGLKELRSNFFKQTQDAETRADLDLYLNKQKINMGANIEKYGIGLAKGDYESILNNTPLQIVKEADPNTRRQKLVEFGKLSTEMATNGIITPEKAAEDRFKVARDIQLYEAEDHIKQDPLDFINTWQKKYNMLKTSDATSLLNKAYSAIEKEDKGLQVQNDRNLLEAGKALLTGKTGLEAIQQMGLPEKDFNLLRQQIAEDDKKSSYDRTLAGNMVMGNFKTSIMDDPEKVTASSILRSQALTRTQKLELLDSLSDAQANKAVLKSETFKYASSQISNYLVGPEGSMKYLSAGEKEKRTEAMAKDELFRRVKAGERPESIWLDIAEKYQKHLDVFKPQLKVDASKLKYKTAWEVEQAYKDGSITEEEAKRQITIMEALDEQSENQGKSRQYVIPLTPPPTQITEPKRKEAGGLEAAEIRKPEVQSRKETKGLLERINEALPGPTLEDLITNKTETKAAAEIRKPKMQLAQPPFIPQIELPTSRRTK